MKGLVHLLSTTYYGYISIKIGFTFSEPYVETSIVSAASRHLYQWLNGYSVTWPLRSCDTSWIPPILRQYTCGDICMKTSQMTSVKLQSVISSWSLKSNPYTLYKLDHTWRHRRSSPVVIKVIYYFRTSCHNVPLWQTTGSIAIWNPTVILQQSEPNFYFIIFIGTTFLCLNRRWNVFPYSDKVW